MNRSVRSLVFILAVAAVGGLATGIEYSQEYKVTGGGSWELLGSSVASLGDVNGDGVPDIVAGSPGSGYAQVLSGADGSTIHYLYGYGGDDFGAAVGNAGDVDGDGVGDPIVGAPYMDYAFVFSGKSGYQIHSVYGMYGGELFGYSVGGVGDADGDGIDDFAVGAPAGYDPNWNQTGYAMVFSGKSASTMHTFYGLKIDECGSAVGGGVDVDGDGYSDIAVGARYAPDNNGYIKGSVTIYSGLKGGTILTLYGDREKSLFGSSLAIAGDVNADGFTDLVVGAPGESTSAGGTGMVRVISGADGNTLHSLYAGSSDFQLGTCVGTAGDADGDGCDDILAGAPGMYDAEGSAQTGGVRVWSGESGEELFTTYGAMDQDAFGTSVCSPGDVDGDDMPDLLVGAPGDDESGSEAGSVCLFLAGEGVTGTVVINGGAAWTTNRDVTLSLTWNSPDSEVREVRVRNVGGAFGDWMEADATLDWTLTAGDGTKQVEVEFRNDAGRTGKATSTSIVLDSRAPTGTISLAGGAAWTNTLTVAVGHTFTDPGSGVAGLRLRIPGEAWGAWVPASGTITVNLPSGEGQKTVEAECRDEAGFVSAVVSDTIGIDLTAPAGTMQIAGGASCTPTRSVSLATSACDSGGSGPAGMRFKRSDSTAWGDWVPCASSCAFVLPTGDGMKGVDAQFRDGAGNESPVVSDTILLDVQAPVLQSLVVNDGRLYVLPQESITVQVTAGDGSGSGTHSFRVTFDGGQTFTPWVPYSGAPVMLDHPALYGSRSLRVAIRDTAGNGSSLSPAVPLRLIEAGAPMLRPGGTIASSLATTLEIDAVAIDLVAGDVLSLKTKVATALLGAVPSVVFDLARPTGERLLTGTPSIAGFVAPATGRYYLIVRQDGAAGAPCTYSLKSSVKQAKANASVKAVVTTGEIEFAAADGSSLKAGLKGEGLDPASVTVVGPDGEVAATVTGKPGSAKFTVLLNQGTGIYRIRFDASGPVAASLGVKLPKGSVVVEP